MRAFALIFVCCALAAVVVSSPASPKYTTKYDNVNLDEILASKRLLGNYVNCLLEKGKCTPDGSELKRVLPDALTNDCASCSEKQREGAERVIRHLIEKNPDIWSQLEAKFDPTGEYTKKYRHYLEEKN